MRNSYKSTSLFQIATGYNQWRPRLHTYSTGNSLNTYSTSNSFNKHSTGDSLKKKKMVGALEEKMAGALEEKVVDLKEKKGEERASIAKSTPRKQRPASGLKFQTMRNERGPQLEHQALATRLR